MKPTYLDNAATTPMYPEIVQEIAKIMLEEYGNPSSSHSFGRKAKNLIELSRKSIAKHFNITAQEIIFTSCGTEANNLILKSAAKDLNIKRIISSKTEHHAVLSTIEYLERDNKIEVDYVKILPNGTINLTHLVELLAENKPTLVSLMHVNNETGAILDIGYVAQICKEYKAFFHTDAVQSVGKTEIDLEKHPIDFLVASAHKFHGPKGIGFAFIRKGISLSPMIIGGEQEKGLRAGTENVPYIVGMAKALELSYNHLDSEREYILDLKNYCIDQLKNIFKTLKINGENGFYNILNVSLPIAADKANLLIFNLDIKGIAVSRGSACQSGSNRPSHVLAEMLNAEDLSKPNLRISFSHFNTRSDIDTLVLELSMI
jgi:cysteine desulfurase